MTLHEWLDLAQSALAQGSATLVAGALGALITIIGVVISAAATRKAQRIQQMNDDRVRMHEYQLGVRRDVYLAAAESIASAVSAIDHLNQLDLDHNAVMADFKSKSGALAKIHIVAKEQTAVNLINFTNEFDRALIDLSILRAPLLQNNDSLKLHQDMIKQLSASRDKYLEEIKQFNIQCIRDDRKWKILNEGFQFEQRRIDEIIKEHDDELSKLRIAHMGFTKECIERRQKLRHLLIPLLASIRAELEMPIDIDQYRKIVGNASTITDEKLKRLYHID